MKRLVAAAVLAGILLACQREGDAGLTVPRRAHKQRLQAPPSDTVRIPRFAEALGDPAVEREEAGSETSGAAAPPGTAARIRDTRGDDEASGEGRTTLDDIEKALNLKPGKEKAEATPGAESLDFGKRLLEE